MLHGFFREVSGSAHDSGGIIDACLGQPGAQSNVSGFCIEFCLRGIVHENTDKAFDPVAILLDEPFNLRNAYTPSWNGYPQIFQFLFPGAGFSLTSRANSRCRPQGCPGMRSSGASKALNIVAIARHLENLPDSSGGREYYMFTDSAEMTFKGGAVADLRKTAETGLMSCPHGAAYVNRMRIYDEKGVAGSAISQNARESRSMSGASIARLSAKFGLESRRGKSDMMVLLV